MPSRRRPKSASPVVRPVDRPVDRVLTDVERFAAALRDSELADKAERKHAQKRQAEAAQRADEAAARKRELDNARRNVERAVQAVRAAKAAGKSTVAADDQWKVAKAHLIELETGAPPAWAPQSANEPEAAELEPAPEPEST